MSRSPSSWLAVAVVLALAVGACESSHSETTVDTVRVPPRTFTSGDLSFRYSPAWQRVPRRCVPVLPAGSPYTLVVLTDDPRSEAVNPPCGRAPGPLPRGGISVVWWVQRPVDGQAGRALTPPTASTVVDSRAVTVKSGDTGACTGLRADSELSAVLDAGAARYGFDACIRGPGVANNRRAVQAMLASVTVRSTGPAAGNE